MGLWITLGIFTLLAILPLGVRVLYDAEGPLVKILLGPVKLTVFPRPKKEEKPKQEKKQEPKQKARQESKEENLPKPPQAPPEPKPPKEKKGGS